MFSHISYDFKSKLHFYTSIRGLGRLTQANYIVILESIIALN
jgi:hypothetical protein